MSAWMEASALAEIVRGSSIVTGPAERLEAILEAEPFRLLPVPEPSLNPLDLWTYRARLSRAESRDPQAPRAYGLADFVRSLERLTEPASAVVIAGSTTRYVVLLDRDQSTVVASTAVEAPPIDPDGISGGLFHE